MKRTYTKELLIPIVANSQSIYEVMRQLGFSTIAGGSHAHISKTIKSLEISTAHFTGRTGNKGKHHVGGLERLTAFQVLCIDRKNGLKEKAHLLRRALEEVGKKYQCEGCGVESRWNDKPLVLEIHHMNRDFLDNRPENLYYLCPNCHSQI